MIITIMIVIIIIITIIATTVIKKFVVCSISDGLFTNHHKNKLIITNDKNIPQNKFNNNSLLASNNTQIAGDLQEGTSPEKDGENVADEKERR